ncbi:MAG TPA: CHAP domain-containing protein [Candidatus Saccharimonadales bacterium]
MVAIGYQPPQKVDNVANAVTTPTAATSQSNVTADQPSVDQLVATNVAAGIAESTGLPIATNVANLSVSLTAEHQLAQSDSNAISKPQIVQPTADSRIIQHYTAQAGDSAATVGAKFGISADTVKWANNLATDAIAAGKDLVILPTDGVLYTVQNGDTAASIASKYQADATRIVSFNDLELSGVTAGRTIVVPGGILPTNERPGYVAPQRASSQGAYDGGYSTIDAQIASASAGNRYAFGNCTWYAYERRVQLGLPAGSFWGNAATWAMYARAAGYQVDHSPSVGAIAQWNAYQGGAGYAGHVGIVESVNSDGSITISEMNYLWNFNRVTSRTIAPSSVSNFIH